MKTESTWGIFKNYINSKNIGDVVSRQELRLVTDCYSNHTDYIRNIGEKTGYLEKFKRNGKIISGVFVVRKHFSENLSVSDLRKEYDNRI